MIPLTLAGYVSARTFLFMSKQKLIPLLVTTAHKGVFFGYGIPTTEKTIRLEQAQMCIYWCTAVKGIFGLAEKGPIEGCRIGPPVPALILQDVTSVTETTEEAAKAWKRQIW